MKPLPPILLFAILGAPVSAAEPRPEDVKFFESKVRPLLAEHCFKCHGPTKQKGNLRLDTAKGVQAGGDSGTPLWVAGKPDDSLLLKAVRHAEGVEKMPPEGKLKDAEIADLAEWVKRGAPFPAATAPEGADPSKHWAFQPLLKPSGPVDVDHFIHAKLDAKRLKPAPPADKRTLIRRAAFDLTGLPPRPEDVEAFVKDDSPAAFERVIDRLLASPAYGERWGRHWLDVARYADSNGLDENVAHGNAWRYRDYVIASFNADKPFNRFLIEQLAGDLLPSASPAERNEHLIATGFLALGPKVLAEVDEKKMELDIVDEQVDTIGRSVMGLTLGCARCHDHKFDPVTAADYYGLAGIFVSTKTMEHFKKVARWHENPLASTEPMKKGETPTAMGATEGKVVDVPVLRRGNHLTPAAVVPRRFPVILAGEKQSALPKAQSGRFELANWLADAKHPLTARVFVNRVWRWHFGAGLVRSTDNFGLIGEKPSHPELLDWLAAEFIRGGWSVKKLHKTIMLSAAYQRGSAHDAKAALADPDNRLLWRMNVRRLEAEAIRDSLLAVGGLLESTVGGPALAHVKNRDYLFDHTSKDKTSYAGNRRSVYLPVIRNNLYDVFQLFDAPDASVPNGDRATTTVPTQALFFMNSDLAIRSADALAARVLQTQSEESRVSLLFALTLGREPDANEMKRVTASVAAFGGDRKAWAAACQAVLASNEFIHIP